MKRIISLMLVAVLVLGTFTGCANKSNNDGDKPALTASLSEIADQVFEKDPSEIQVEQRKIDLADDSEEGQWLKESALGMKDVSKIKEAVLCEPMIGSIAFSMVLVRVNDPADAENVAKEMKENINPNKWVCVTANDIQAVGYGDVVMFIMLDDGLDLSTQTYVDAFKDVCGADLDFTIK